MEYVIKNLHYTVTVSSLGAEITSIKSDTGAELIWPGTDPKHWRGHAPLLFPVCGRLKDARYTYNGTTYNMSSHGFISKCEFAPVFVSDAKLVLVFSSNEETKKIYPFDFDFTATYELCGKDILFTAEVKNKSEELLPYMFGWHPGFTLPTEGGVDINSYRIEFSGRDEVLWTPLQHACFARPYAEPYKLTSGAYPIREEEIYKNDTMIFSDCGNEIKLSADGAAYALNMSWSENLPFLCIWKSPVNSAKFICLEPWTGTPGDGETEENFETRSMIRLEPDGVDRYSYKLNFEF